VDPKTQGNQLKMVSNFFFFFEKTMEIYIIFGFLFFRAGSSHHQRLILLIGLAFPRRARKEKAQTRKMSFRFPLFFFFVVAEIRRNKD